MKYLVTLLLATNIFAQDRAGNGGNFTKAQIAGHKATLEQTSSKIRTFLIQNPELQKTFPEFSIEDFYNKTEHLAIEVVNEEVFDKDGVKRTCTNLPDLIKCDANEVEKMSGPVPVFVLMFHELLGTTGLVDDFRVSDRLATFVTKTQNYDLVISSKESTTSKSFAGHYALVDGPAICPEVLDIEHSKRLNGFVLTRELNKKNFSLRNSRSDYWILGTSESVEKQGNSIIPQYHAVSTKTSLHEDHFLRRYEGHAYGSNQRKQRAKARDDFKLIEQIRFEDEVLVHEYLDGKKVFTCKYLNSSKTLHNR